MDKKKGKLKQGIGVLLAAALAFSTLPIGGYSVYALNVAETAADASVTPAAADGKVSADYQAAIWDGNKVTYTTQTAESCTPVANSTTVWESGWYVVMGDVTISSRVTVSGDVHLILTDGCMLDAQQGITVNSGNNLTIYAQTGGTGSLTATASGRAAGIGGDSEGKNGGTITINGGNITAANSGGSSRGPGIGGGNNASDVTVIIHGGTVNATGGSWNPGIGGYNGGTITITGGTVTATHGEYYYQDFNGTPTITGGTVNGKTYGITVTFVTDTAAVTIPEQNIYEGETAVRPGDPNGYVLSFFSDASYTTRFDFGSAITQSLTIYVKCEVNDNYIVSVTTGGVETKYTGIESFVNAIKGASGEADVKLLQNVDLGSLTLTIPDGVTLTLDGGEYTLTGSGSRTVSVDGTFNLTGGTLLNTGFGVVVVQGSGSFTMSGGVVDYRGGVNNVAAVAAIDNASRITITGGTVGSLSATIGTVKLSGGTYSLINATSVSTKTAADIVEKGYALKGADGLIRRDTSLTTGLYNVTVVECPHTGAVTDNGNGTHGGDCPYCGTESAAAPHTLGEGNKCEGCGTPLKVQVQTSEGTTIYLGESDFAKAFDTYYNYDNVTVTLLSNIQADSIEMGGTQAGMHILNTSTLDLAGHTITSSDTAIYIYPTGNLTIADSSSGKAGRVVSTNGAAILTQTGMVSLTGGTYKGNPAIDGKNSSTNVSSLLANYGTQTTPHYAYFDTQGKPIALEENQRELTGTVMVRKCTHNDVKATSNGNGTHSLNCPYCGYTGTTDACTGGSATCRTKAVCEICGNEYGELTDHSWNNGEETKAPTCTEKGTTTFTCTVSGCDAARTKDITALGHIYKNGKCTRCQAVDPEHSCTGGSATCRTKAVCEICGNEYGELAAHRFTNYVYNNDATCTTDGTETAMCDFGCGTSSVARIKSGTALGHDWSDWTTTTAATCTATGTRERSCKRTGCTEKQTETVEMTAHNYDWQSDESNHWGKCSVCGNESTAAAHTEDSGTVTTQPTVDSEGVRTFKCSICGYVMRTEVIPKHEHSFGTEWISDSTNHWHICECGEKTTIAAHGWNSGEVTKQPTTTSEGVMTYTCTVCGKTKTETIPKHSSGGSGGSGGSSRPGRPSTPTPGTITNNIRLGVNAPKVEIKMTNDDLIKAVCTSEEQQLIKNGMDGKIILSVNNVDEEFFKGFLGGSDYTVVLVLDIDIFKEFGGSEIEVTQTNGEITLEIEMPEAFRAKGKEFVVIRYHNGERSVLDDLDNSDSTVTFKSDRFSLYGLAYRTETVDPGTSDTSDTTSDNSGSGTTSNGENSSTGESSGDTSDSGTTSNGNTSSSDESGTTSSGSTSSGESSSSDSGTSTDDNNNPSTGLAISIMPFTAAMAALVAAVKRRKR